MTETASRKQVDYIAALEAKSGHAWTEYVNCPAGAKVEQMPKTIASKVIGALLAECPAKASTYRRSYTDPAIQGTGHLCTSCGNPGYDCCC